MLQYEGRCVRPQLASLSSDVQSLIKALERMALSKRNGMSTVSPGVAHSFDSKRSRRFQSKGTHCHTVMVSSSTVPSTNTALRSKSVYSKGRGLHKGYAQRHRQPEIKNRRTPRYKYFNVKQRGWQAYYAGFNDRYTEDSDCHEIKQTQNT